MHVASLLWDILDCLRLSSKPIAGNQSNRMFHILPSFSASESKQALFRFRSIWFYCFDHQVGHTGFEPVTSCLSSKRSKPTELISHLQYKFSFFRRNSKSSFINSLVINITN